MRPWRGTNAGDARVTAPGRAGAGLVGRRRELALLREQFAAAARGQAVVTLVAGDPGIGKTRLLAALVARAAEAGARVLHGGASEAEGMPPYLPFLEALGTHIRTAAPEEVRAQAGALAPVLARILPELATKLGDLPASYPLPPEQARLRLYEAVGAFLAAIAATRPLVLLLDDLQWADAASLDLLGHVARTQPAARLLILGAYRAGEVAHNRALERILAELNRLRALTIVTAGPLSAAEIAALAAGVLGDPVDPAVERALYAQSEGNPFFAEELLRGWSEAGALERTDRGRIRATGASLPLPLGITGAVRQRLARLSPELLDLLRTAAIIGRVFDPPLLAEAADQEEEAAEERLLEGCRAGVIQPLPAAGGGAREGCFTFQHDTIRETLYAEVTAVRRRRLHGFIGRALERRSNPEGAQDLADLAFHFTRSGDRGRGADYARRAAEQALSAYALDEALTHYRTALDLLDVDDPGRGAVLLALGETAVRAGMLGEAVTALEAAPGPLSRSGDVVVAARAAHALGQARWRLDEHAAAQAAFETALAHLGERPLPETVRVLVDLSSLLVLSLGRQAEGIAHGRRALDLARHLGDPRLEAAASRSVGNLLVRGNDIAAGLPLLERALALAEAADDPAEAAECCSCLSLACAWKGEVRRFFDLTERRVEFARRAHDLYQLRHAYSWSMARQIYEGNWAQVDEMLARAQAVVDQLAGPDPEAFLYNVRGGLAFSRGDYAAAEEWFTRSTAIFRRMGPGVLVWFIGPLLLTQQTRGKRREALATLAEAEELVAANQAGTIATGDALVYLAMAAVALGDRSRAARYHPRLLPFAGLCIDVLVDRVLGELETLLGDRTAARAHLAAAEALARREHLKPELARTIEARANLQRAEGGRDAAALARGLLEQAHTIFVEFGMAGEARRVAARLDDPAERSKAGAHPAFPAGLSRREAEVLRLVADGKSNRRIAEDLFLSEKTVINHLTSIFAKTGADNRAAATAFAIRHGLA